MDILSRLLLKVFPSKGPRYTYGRIARPPAYPSDRPYSKEQVRLDNSTGRVEFIIWEAGEQGHTEVYWQSMGEGWVKFFTPYTVQPTEEQL
jgi:hypothetical protein